MLNVRAGDIITWRVVGDGETAEEGDVVGSITLKGPHSHSKPIKLPFRENTTAGKIGWRTKCALNFVGGPIAILSREATSEGFIHHYLPLTAYGVADGDALSWTFCPEISGMDAKEQISVKLVSEKGASVVHTVTLAKGATARNLKKYLSEESKEAGMYSFQSNGCEADEKQGVLRNLLKLNEGDIITWLTKSEAKKRLHETDQDAEIPARPQKRQRTE